MGDLIELGARRPSGEADAIGRAFAEAVLRLIADAIRIACKQPRQGLADFAGDLRRIVLGFAFEMGLTPGEVLAVGDAVMEIIGERREHLRAFADELAQTTASGPEAA